MCRGNTLGTTHSRAIALLLKQVHNQHRHEVACKNKHKTNQETSIKCGRGQAKSNRSHVRLLRATHVCTPFHEVPGRTNSATIVCTGPRIHNQRVFTQSLNLNNRHVPHCPPHPTSDGSVYSNSHLHAVVPLLPGKIPQLRRCCHCHTRAANTAC